MRTRIMSGIVGVVLCTGVAVGSAAPASAAGTDPVLKAAAAAVQVLEGRPHVPQSPCIDCW
ncbi:hypothetical protein FE634_02590 [Nocardioides dongxiaopingii]|uniref:hypothetical protein n=1 Tax=Nocardioides TaxID=1839 RepID=UPI0010C76E62|nr:MULTISPECIES: hypothetical protein [Nocardioides]QCW49575.1 hypothetical protein FE634_02590 [Nocardioides sp. S-1144]